MIKAFLFLVIAGISIHSKLLKCPNPRHPKAALNELRIKDTSRLRLVLDTFVCLTSEGEFDLTFRLQYLYVDNRQVVINSFAPFDYLFSVAPCLFEFYYYPDFRSAKFLNTFLQPRKSSVFFCGRNYTDCKAVTWMCGLIPRTDYESRISVLVSYMMAPDQNWTGSVVVPNIYRNYSTPRLQPVSLFRSGEGQISSSSEVLGYYLMGFILLLIACVVFNHWNICGFCKKFVT